VTKTTAAASKTQMKID